MDVSLEPGKYVVAVSGGVDSVVLLNVLGMIPDLELVVAHFDHGIREESSEDAKFVRDLAVQYQLPFKLGVAKLGSDASEATAREHRYKFLREIKNGHGSRAIITAHHQDDLIETAMINLTRGTGRRGMSSLASGKEIVRPLLGVPKKEILLYAQANQLAWREDPTNQDAKYLRNKIRHVLKDKLNDESRKDFLDRTSQFAEINQEIDAIIDDMAREHASEQGIERAWFRALPDDVASEVVASYLRKHSVAFDRKTIQRLVVDIRIKHSGKVLELQGGAKLRVGREYVCLQMGDKPGCYVFN